ncbi:tripartite tricarboxylate transporter TctB family protein [Bacillus sp. UMB0899]|nr:tripartite tricarboxylate transporter TctB family protein [Bacillus sp. UMB0899]
MARMNKDIFASAFFIVFSIVMYIASNSIIKLTVSKVGADFVPKLVAIGMLILSIFYLINSVKQQIRSKKELNSQTSVNKEEEVVEEKKKISPLSVLGTVGLLALYITLLPYLGFLIMTTVYLFFQMYLLAAKTERNIPIFIVISIITSVFIYYIFKYVFHLMLPAGILG